MNRLQNYINPDEQDRAKGSGLIDTAYKGLNSEIHGRKGKAFYIAKENQWYFSACSDKIPVKDREWYRVNESSLDFEA